MQLYDLCACTFGQVIFTCLGFHRVLFSEDRVLYTVCCFVCFVVLLLLRVVYCYRLVLPRVESSLAYPHLEKLRVVPKLGRFQIGYLFLKGI